MAEINFVEFDTNFLILSWDWLQDPEIKLLTDTPDFTRDEQFTWYERLKSCDDYKIWGIELDTERIGVCGLKNISSKSAEYFGYIGNKSLWGKGFSKFLLEFACSKAIEMGLERISLKVLNSNGRALNAYKKFGFIVTEQDERYTYMIINT